MSAFGCPGVPLACDRPVIPGFKLAIVGLQHLEVQIHIPVGTEQ